MLSAVFKRFYIGFYYIFQMYHRVACSLRENPSKVQHFQAGINKKDKSEREEITEVKQTKKRQM